MAPRLIATNNVGYQNYVDRSDFNGGADLGYKVDKDFAFVVGYRAGQQYQERLSHAIDKYGQTSDNDYQRLLFGFEGKPLSWLTAKFLAGPDFRSYDSSAPVREDHQVRYYGEGSLTAQATKDDTIGLNYKQWQWVSSTGKNPYDDNTFGLTYKHQYNSQWSSTLGACAQSSDYTCGETLGSAGTAGSPPYYRNDWYYTFSAGVQYAITANVTLDASYVATLGRNGEPNYELAKVSGGLPATKRQFDDQVVSVGAKYKF